MKKLEKGFTLIELMIVVAIIAILAAVAAPRFGQQLRKAQDAKGIEVVGAWRSALNIEYSDSGVYPVNFGQVKDSVDGGTLAKTFHESATTSQVADADTTAWVKVGTSTTGKAASFGFDSASTTDNAINFTSSNGIDTKGTSWSAY